MILTPRFSSTSAAPLLLETLLLPCLATLAPQPAITNEDVVEILNVLDKSPPVPTMSIASLQPSMVFAFSLITLARPVISSIVSPLILNAVRNEEICASVALPLMIIFIAFIDSSSVRSF